jgi:ubiquinone/menaquinone biosynthesis C-methylase UbiE
MLSYSKKSINSIFVADKQIDCFLIDDKNIDDKTVNSFGEEWTKFSDFSEKEIQTLGDEYFDIVTSEHINKNSVVLDMGCGTGRWTKYLSSKVKFVEAIDPSDAILSAAHLLKNEKNVRISKAGSESIPFEDNTFDFVFSLGVLHHIPDTQQAMQMCVNKLKKDGYFLVYLYYSLDNRGVFYNFTFLLSNLVRKLISSMPANLKKVLCDFIAYVVYLPMIGLSNLLSFFGIKSIAQKIPLHHYSGKSLNVIRNDALDRFGTPLEQRFSKSEINSTMEKCGLKNIVFSENAPFWHAIGQKK